MKGQSNGRRYCPNFGRFAARKYFKAFVSAAPYFFADKKWYHVDKIVKTWDTFLPYLNKCNERWRTLIDVVSVGENYAWVVSQNI